MPEITLFNAFKERAVEDMNLGTDQFAIALTNTAPVVGNSVIADLTQIAYTNLSARALTTVSSGQTAGTYELVFADLTLTASGAVGPFRYAAIYNDTLTGDPLVGFVDLGSAITMAAAEEITLDFDGAAITLS